MIALCRQYALDYYATYLYTLVSIKIESYCVAYAICLLSQFQRDRIERWRVMYIIGSSV
jgi:hypothetical protein